VSSLVILVASIFEISYVKTDRHTAVKPYPRPATDVGGQIIN